MKIISLTFFTLALSLFSYGQVADSLQLDTYSRIEKLLKENNVPAVGIGIIRGNELCQVNVFGKLKKDGNIAPYNTIFNVASLTKPIVGMLTLKLVSMGKWNLDEPIAKYWTDPDIKNDPRNKKITTRIILSHQTGFKNWRYLNPSKKLTIDFEPGTQFGYSGEGFEYLQKALENKFKTSLAKLADSLIFKPLKMQDSYMIWDKLVDETRFACWHDKDGNNSYPTDKRKEASAADDLLTTIEDYGQFCSFVLKGFGLPKPLFKEMITPQAKIAENDEMGLTWEIVSLSASNNYALMHTGGDKGVCTLVVLCPKTGEGLIVFTNGDKGENLYPAILSNLLSFGKDIIKFL